jgi:hypothetical protein
MSIRKYSKNESSIFLSFTDDFGIISQSIMEKPIIIVFNLSLIGIVIPTKIITIQKAVLIDAG